MVVLNFINHQTKEELFLNVKNLKKMFGFKHSDVKHGELTPTAPRDASTFKRYQEFISSMENLCAHTFQEYLKFFRLVFTQKDYNGRTPFHYAKYEKAILDTLNFDLENKDCMDEFKQECKQLQFLEDETITKPIEPNRYFNALKELKHFLHPEVYDAIHYEYLKEKKLLLKDIMNSQDVCQETPLHIASRRGNYILVSKYLKYGAEINRNSHGHTPLDLAKDKFTRKALTNLNVEAYNCADSNLIQLMEKGEHVDQRYTIFGEPALHKAVDSTKQERISTIKTLLDYAADINLIDYNGWTALHHAAVKGDIESSLELIENGANVNAYSTSMKTPLHLAAYHNHPEIIQILVNAGASLEGISNDEFLQYSTNKHSIVSENVAPLLQAAKRGHIECFELLLRLGASFYTSDIRNWNCLHYATYHNHLNMIRLILRLDYENNNLRNMKNTGGNIPQHLCACLKAKLIYDEIWFPEEHNEDLDAELEELQEQNQLS